MVERGNIPIGDQHTMTATDMRAAFLADIIANPDDDAPRLIFADWLEDNGEGDRAEFIRVQCELDRLRPGPEEHRKASNLLARYRKGAPVRMGARTPATLLVRETLLLDDGWSRWLHGAFDGVADDIGCSTSGRGVNFGVSLYRRRSPFTDKADVEAGHFDCSFRRGFVAEVTLTCAVWLAHGPAVVRAAPVEVVRLTTRPGAEEILAFVRDRNQSLSYGENREEQVGRWLSEIFPHIAFILPG